MADVLLRLVLLISLALVAQSKECKLVYSDIFHYLNQEEGIKHDEVLKTILEDIPSVQSFDGCASLKQWKDTIARFVSAQEDATVEGHRAVVIGGGPSAMASAAMLVNLGFRDVQLYGERGADYNLKHVINAFPTAIRDPSTKREFKNLETDLSYGMRSLMEELGFLELAADANTHGAFYHLERKAMGNPLVLRHSVLCRFLRLSLQYAGVTFNHNQVAPTTEVFNHFSVVVIATGSSDKARWREFFTTQQNVKYAKKSNNNNYQDIVRSFSVLYPLERQKYIDYSQNPSLIEIAFVIHRPKPNLKSVPNYCNYQAVKLPDYDDTVTYSFRIFRDMKNWCQIIIKLLPSQRAIPGDISMVDHQYKDNKWQQVLREDGTKMIQYYQNLFGLSDDEIKELKVYHTSPPKIFHNVAYENLHDDNGMWQTRNDVADTFEVGDRRVAVFLVGDVVRSALPDWGMGTNDAAAMANELRSNFAKEVFDEYAWDSIVDVWPSAYSGYVWEREVAIHRMIQKFQANIYQNIKDEQEDDVDIEEDMLLQLQASVSSLSLRDRLLSSSKRGRAQEQVLIS